MIFNFRALRLLLAVLTIFSFVLYLPSCSDDDPEPEPEPDTEKPVITIVSPSNVTLPLRGTVTVRAEATDNTGIATVQVFLDGDLLAEATTSPVEGSWDTKTAAEGTHSIKIIARDIEDNIAELEVNVEVRNILFTFDVLSNYLPDGIEGWIFVNDEDGVAIGAEQVVNGSTYTFQTPEGYSTEDKYTFTLGTYEFFDIEGYTVSGLSLLSYADAEHTSYTIGEQTVAEPAVVGQHTLVVTQGAEPDYNSKVIVSPNAKFGSPSGMFEVGTYPMAADMFASPADIIYMLYNRTANPEELIPVKYKVSNAVAGEMTEVNQSDFTEFDSYTVSIPGAVVSSYSINLVQREGDYSNMSFFLNKVQFTNPEELVVLYPDLIPHEYISVLSSTLSGDVGDFYRLISLDLPTTQKTLNASLNGLTDSGAEIEVNITGDFDYFRLVGGFGEVTESGEYGIGWLYYAPKSSIGVVKQPQLPTELIDAHPEFAGDQSQFDGSMALRSTGVDDYQDWVKKRNNGVSILNISKEEYRKSKQFPQVGTPGRRAAGKWHGRFNDLDDRLMGLHFK